METKDLLIIPFHDWRKSEKEGFRTRDVHFIRALNSLDSVRNILVINRPTTALELILKNFSKKLKGEIILEKKNFRLTKVHPGLFVTDCFSKDIMGQFLKRQAWFIEQFNRHDYLEFIEECQRYLAMDSAPVLCQNIFAFKLVSAIDAPYKQFDAWDNFLKFPAYKKFRNKLEKGYEKLAEVADSWMTNSRENMEFYSQKFNPQEIFLVKNGVSKNFASISMRVPDDLKVIPGPIFGFGGKISYLLDTDLINHAIAACPEASFVFVGQILDKKIFAAIEKRKNVFFLGDKPYSEYPHYVNQFDVGLVPYHVEEKQHGGDSMKAYEYLMLEKKVVGTNGNGLEDLKEYVHIAHNPEEFVRALKDGRNEKPRFPFEAHTWEAKAIQLMESIQTTRHGT